MFPLNQNQNCEPNQRIIPHIRNKNQWSKHHYMPPIVNPTRNATLILNKQRPEWTPNINANLVAQIKECNTQVNPGSIQDSCRIGNSNDRCQSAPSYSNLYRPTITPLGITH